LYELIYGYTQKFMVNSAVINANYHTLFDNNKIIYYYYLALNIFITLLIIYSELMIEMQKLNLF